MADLHALPKFRDSWSYLYVEHCRIDKQDQAIVLHDQAGETAVPCATLSLLMLGPGTTITHAAVTVLAASGCTVVWSGEAGIRFYAQGAGETRSSAGVLRQAQLVSDPGSHLRVVARMYAMRFPEPLEPGLTLQQIRGKEGARVRSIYSRLSHEFGVEWTGRSYDRGRWGDADPVNRAVSAANSCMYGLCHAAIVSIGLSPALGFIHTGKQLSFVYDVADLYKMDITVPVAFQEAAGGADNVESRVRRALRDRFHERRLLPQIVDDVYHLLELDKAQPEESVFDVDAALPADWWNPAPRVLEPRGGDPA